MAEHDANDKSNALNGSPDDLDLFDKLQDEFDALLSGKELPAPNAVHFQDDDLTDSVLQDSSEFLSTADMSAFDLSSDKPSADTKEPQAAKADNLDSTVLDEPETSPPENTTNPSEIPPTAPLDTIEPGMTDHQGDDSITHHAEESTAVVQETPANAALSENANKIFLKGSDLSDVSPSEKEDSWQPKPNKASADLNEFDPFSEDADVADTERAPVHPDMSSDHVPQRQGGSRFIIPAGIIVAIVAAGIYWFSGETQEPAKQLASGQEQGDSKADAKQASLSGTSSLSPAETQQAPENTPTETASLKQQQVEQAAAAQQAKTEKEAIQRAAVKKAKAEQLAAKQAAVKRAAAEKANAKHQAVEKTAVKQIATIEPSTHLQKQALKDQQASPALADEPGDWVIDLASVNSDKSARQHMARIRAMGVESKAVQMNDKGRVFHHIRIVGFTSKREAMKRRDELAKLLGIRGAKVEKL